MTRFVAKMALKRVQQSQFRKRMCYRRVGYNEEGDLVQRLLSPHVRLNAARVRVFGDQISWPQRC